MALNGGHVCKCTGQCQVTYEDVLQRMLASAMTVDEARRLIPPDN